MASKPAYTPSSDGHATVARLLSDDEFYGHTLLAFSSEGDTEVVRLLLENAAYINTRSRYYSHALQAASSGGHKRVVQLLLEKGVDVNATGGYYGNGLQAACAGGHHEVVKLLLEKGANVNAKGGRFGHALQAASSRGDDKLVQVLLQAGAEVNAQGGHYSNALQAASFRGEDKLVQVLLQAGADVNAQGGHHSNALQAASFRGYSKVVQVLLEAGADINAWGGIYGQALQAASSRGHNQVVQMLLQAGADVNARGGRYGYALQAASFRGNSKVVQVLLQAGADINAQGGYYGNALQASIFGGNGKMVQMLLRAGADVNAQGGYYGNALQAALFEGNNEMVQLLLQAGADFDARGGYYGNALQAASFRGNENAVQALLRAGADVNAQGGTYGNALQAASFRGYSKVVQVLLHAGADVNAQSGTYGNALQAACFGGHKEVVQLLLKVGADVNAERGLRNALQAASYQGHEEVVRMLLGAAGKETTARISPKTREKELKWHDEFALSRSGTAKPAADHLGLWEEAERLEVRAIETNEKLGPNHPDTLTSISILASTCWSLGRWRLADELFVQVIETTKSVLLTGLETPGSMSAVEQVLTCDEVEILLRSIFEPQKDLHIVLNWQAKKCVQEDLEGDNDLRLVLTVTGDSFKAYATTCERYIKERWGTIGIEVLSTFSAALKTDRAQSTNLELFWEPAGEYVMERSIASVKTERFDHALSIVQTLVWLAATFRLPHPDALRCSSVKISTHATNLHITLEDLARPEVERASSCWQALLPGTVIATGFRVPSRSENGLELPFNVMLDLTGMLFDTDFSEVWSDKRNHKSVAVDGNESDSAQQISKNNKAVPPGMFFSGVDCLLYPVKFEESSRIIRWHYETCNQRVVPRAEDGWQRANIYEYLESARHILGYTPHAVVHLGTEDRSEQYRVMRRTSAEPERDGPGIAFDGVKLGFSHLVQGSLDFKYKPRKGQRASFDPEKRCYDDIVRKTQERPVILYDTAENCSTGWLVSQLSVILDLVQRETRTRRDWTVNFPYAMLQSNAGSAASQVLTNNRNADVILYRRTDDGKDFTVKDLVKTIYVAMAKRHTINQAELLERGNPGWLNTEKLIGWDLIELADPPDHACRFVRKIHETKIGAMAERCSWLPIAVEVPVFFCENLGDIITSAVNDCCSRIHPGRAYLAASLHVLRHLIQEKSDCCHCHFNLLRGDLVWELSGSQDMTFHECRHTAPDGKGLLDIVQVLRRTHRCRTAGGTRQLYINGAVVFGKQPTLFGRAIDFVEDIVD